MGSDWVERQLAENRKSIYTLYNENGESALFWIRKKNWNETIAYVLDIQGMVSGELDEFGKPPYYANPKPNCAYFFDGELTQPKRIIVNGRVANGRFANVGIQSGAGSNNWELVETPEWWNEELADELNLPFWED